MTPNDQPLRILMGVEIDANLSLDFNNYIYIFFKDQITVNIRL